MWQKRLFLRIFYVFALNINPLNIFKMLDNTKNIKPFI